MSIFVNDRELDYGIPATMERGCPISCHLPDDDHLPFFTIGDPAGKFDLHFDLGALREFLRLAAEALTRLDTTNLPEHPSAPEASGTKPTTIDLAPWAWINDGCTMDYEASAPVR